MGHVVRGSLGIPCFVGTISLLGLSIAIDSCEVTNPGDVCSNPGSPVIVQLDDIASLSLAVGVSNICDTDVMTIADIFITDLRSRFLNMGFWTTTQDWFYFKNSCVLGMRKRCPFVKF